MNQIATRITVVDGIPTTTTQDIADVYVKRHDNVLAIVRARMSEAGEWGVLNFKETPYTNPQNGQTYNVIRMTKKGFHFVVGKFTGAKAVQHQIAFADEFERMELALTGRQAPALPSTITPAQQQALQELVGKVVDSGKQGYAETWSRFHRKFRVAKYNQLPIGQFDDAVAYLNAKLDGTPVHDADLVRVSAGQIITHAADMAGQLFAQVIKQAALNGSHIDRFVVTADYKARSVDMNLLQADTRVMNDAEWLDHFKARVTHALAA